MDLAQVTRLRTLAGKAGAIFCLLAFVMVLDGLISRFREPVNVFHVLPGTVMEITGPLAGKAGDIRDLTWTSDTEHLHLKFITGYAGYFLGGSMWRGQLTVRPATPPGKYALVVGLREPKPEAPPLSFRVQVHPDAVGLRQSSVSLVQRHVGLSPWLAALACLPFIVLTFGYVFLLSWKMEKLLLQSGKAEIYRVLRRNGVYEVTFGLGSEHGVKVGDRLDIFDPEGNQVGTVEVKEAGDRDSVGLAVSERELRPGLAVWLSR